ncbi:hypothetical protein C7B77_28160 [Chamaesiphon polymorphus CCALA 037]|uniref:Uncharacterized protein n=1 Tax=Chamaesiphon polymorphus CCALA 037 TaxID=2107692 RepID=A0A2T1F6M3_9CYAN|nr:hypothetical protein C7B77_28160 [Chamaesiphon polymorphus CCALA 037]
MANCAGAWSTGAWSTGAWSAGTDDLSGHKITPRADILILISAYNLQLGRESRGQTSERAKTY